MGICLFTHRCKTRISPITYPGNLAEILDHFLRHCYASKTSQNLPDQLNSMYTGRTTHICKCFPCHPETRQKTAPHQPNATEVYNVHCETHLPVPIPRNLSEFSEGLASMCESTVKESAHESGNPTSSPFAKMLSYQFSDSAALIHSSQKLNVSQSLKLCLFACYLCS